jgi:hypothetical protein
MGKLLAQLEQMASSSSGGSSLGSSIGKYLSDTPSTVTVNPMMDAGYEATGGMLPAGEVSPMIDVGYEATGAMAPRMYDRMAGMSAAEREMYGEADGITTDLGEAHDISITGGSEAGYKNNIGSFLSNLATSGLGSGKGPVPVEPVQGSPSPELKIPQSIKGFRPTESPYGIPSELGTQAEIQAEIARRIAKQLENTIVKRPYLNFQGLI